jgi:chorismate mutase/prephenate dehydratase
MPERDRPGPGEDFSTAMRPLRERIDAIDARIVELLNERAEIALEIGRLKDAAGGRAIRDPAREQEVIEHALGTSAGLFPDEELVALYRKLIAATRKVQEEQRRRGA